MNKRMYDKYAKKAVATPGRGTNHAHLILQSTGTKANRSNSVPNIQPGLNSGTNVAPDPLQKKKSLKKIATGVMMANGKFEIDLLMPFGVYN